jgi:molybdopterin converting factor subunit 1
MIVAVQFFAAARDRVGRSVVKLDLPDHATVGDLRRQLVSDYAPLGEILARTMVAVDQEYVGDDCPLSSSSEVAIIPPVSGG